MSSQKELTSLEASILQNVEDRGVVRGNVLRRLVREGSIETFGKAVRNLVMLELIAASGNTSDPKSAFAAHFSPVPSRRMMAKRAVKGTF